MSDETYIDDIRGLLGKDATDSEVMDMALGLSTYGAVVAGMTGPEVLAALRSLYAPDFASFASSRSASESEPE